VPFTPSSLSHFADHPPGALNSTFLLFQILMTANKPTVIPAAIQKTGKIPAS
jgi:hypothetical protein